MDAYAVLEGGGVKGAAFAGALEAASRQGIKFVGYGGASAGAIVAFLATLNYSGEQILKAMQEVCFTKLLNEPVEGELQAAIEEVEKLQEEIKGKSLKGIAWHLFRNHKKKLANAKAVVSRIADKHGAYTTRNIVSLLSYHACITFGDEKLKYCPIRDDLHLSFKDLYSLTGKDLQVISTDLTSGTTCIYSHTETPDDCVFQAIAASASYPFVYMPTKDGQRYLVDGGLSCNLPTYLFTGDRYKSLPIFAFDLYKKPTRLASDTSDSDILTFAKKLLFSALDASDDIINNVVGGISIPVEVPSNIGTLDFDLDSAQITQLYKTGYKSAYDYLSNHPYKKILKGSNLRLDKARFLYGHCHQPILETLTNKANITDVSPIKTWLYTCINADEKQIFSFENYTNGNKIEHHEFPLDQEDNDCVKAWLNKVECFSYDSNRNKTRICFPIIRNSVQYHLDLKGAKNYDDGVVLGVLCVAMDCNFEETGWFEESSEHESGYEIDRDFVSLVQPYIDIIEKVMLGAQASFTFKESDNEKC